MESSANRKYFQLTAEQLDKVGNAMIFLSEKIPDIPKTKMLKLLYILDEFSIRNSGIPFFNLQYKVWKLGPVAEDIFIELSDKLFRFDKYITVESNENKVKIYPKSDFCDDEFSDNDIKLLEYVSEKFKETTSSELIAYTHRPHSLWRRTAEANDVYRKFENEEINITDIIINMGELVEHDERKKNIFEQYIREK